MHEIAKNPRSGRARPLAAADGAASPRDGNPPQTDHARGAGESKQQAEAELKEAQEKGDNEKVSFGEGG